MRLFDNVLPRKMYCCDKPANGLMIRNKPVALTFEHIQPNYQSRIAVLPFDYDERGAFIAADEANVAQPNYIAVNPKNGRGHLGYILETPVLKYPESRSAPISLLAAVQRGMTKRLGADPHFKGLITKNPLHQAWDVTWLRDRPYGLAELAEYLFASDMRRPRRVKECIALGRNDLVYKTLTSKILPLATLRFKKCGDAIDDLRKFAIAEAHNINVDFSEPLSAREIKATATSATKWAWRTFTLERFARIQSWRGSQTRRSTKTRMAIVEGLANGST